VLRCNYLVDVSRCFTGGIGEGRKGGEEGVAGAVCQKSLWQGSRKPAGESFSESRSRRKVGGVGVHSAVGLGLTVRWGWG